MNADRGLRAALWISGFFNLGGAALFAFPAAPPGRWLGLPQDVAPLYCALVALFVLLFGGLYIWLARRPVIDRPMVALAAIGKGGAFLMFLAFWLAGEFGGLAMLVASGDGVLATVFAAWLRATRAT